MSPMFFLATTAVSLDVVASKARTLDYTRSAVMRNPVLRRNVDQWWYSQRQEAEWALDDERLEAEAERVGMGIGRRNVATGENEGRMRAKIRAAVAELGRLAWSWDRIEGTSNAYRVVGENRRWQDPA